MKDTTAEYEKALDMIVMLMEECRDIKGGDASDRAFDLAVQWAAIATAFKPVK